MAVEALAAKEVEIGCRIGTKFIQFHCGHYFSKFLQHSVRVEIYLNPGGHVWPIKHRPNRSECQDWTGYNI
jgi:hypothetical protein